MGNLTSHVIVVPLRGSGASKFSIADVPRLPCPVINTGEVICCSSISGCRR